MFIELNAEVFRVLKETDQGSYVISCEIPGGIVFIDVDVLQRSVRVEAPDFYIENSAQVTTGSQAMLSRLRLIQPLIDDEQCIVDRCRLLRSAEEIARAEHTTRKRVLRLFYTYLAIGTPSLGKKVIQGCTSNPVFDAAIRKYYYSAKRLPLSEVYTIMLSESFSNSNGVLMDSRPTWHSFRNYFYRNRFHKSSRKEIAREGLTSYQRNSRPLYGSQSVWRDRLGTFQMDATIADIHLVDECDSNTVIGRPNIYLAVDTASRLIAGVYVGMEQGETSVLACLVNGGANKVALCKKYGISITPEQWPNTGLPKRIVVDRGTEFFGERIGELCVKYGILVERLKPFRPDQKGAVEKTFDLLQEKYKPLLRGKGVIEGDAQERWAIDYREQASLTLREFTAIILQCVIYLNSMRTLGSLLPEQAGAVPTAAGIWKWCDEHGRSDMLKVQQEELYRISLARKNATMTRTGLNFHGLRYINTDYKERFFDAGKNGNRVVTVAYDVEKTRQIFLISNGEYIPFVLAPASYRYGEMSFAEYDRIEKEMKSKAKEQDEKSIEGQVNLRNKIQAITKGKEK